MIAEAARQALHERMGEAVRFDVPMSKHTSLRIGGPADALATPPNRAGLVALLECCHAFEVPLTVLGSGFNVLVRDGGIAGMVVILKKLRTVEACAGPGIIAEAGASHATVTRFCVDHGLAGLEFAAGIPGTVGGWIAMNAGIGTREMKDVVSRVDLVDLDGSNSRSLPRAELDFRYRELHGQLDRVLVIAAHFDVSESTREKVKSEVDALNAKRSATQPLDVPSCGSVFRNPDGDFAGRLIEHAGLRGKQIGQAQISPVHANFIANLGGAGSDDVLALIEHARSCVAESTGITLQTEVKIIGRAA
jgi:UDP-N-acetylmuramate dehydrogenase